MSFTESLEELVAANATGLLSAHRTWRRVPLGLIFDVQNGFPFESKLFNTSGQGMPLLRIRDVLSGSTATYYSGEYDPAFVVNRGDIVVGMDGDFNCRVWRGEPALLNQRVCRLTPRNDCYLSQLLVFALQGYLDAVNAKTSAITVKHLSSETIKAIPLPLPPRGEQQRIVEAIDSYLTRLDDAVASLERVQAKLKAYRASVLKAAVEGRLVPTEASVARAEKRQYEPASVLLSRTEAPPRPNRWNSRSTDVVLGHSALAVGNPRSALPEGWAWSPLVNIARMESGHTPSREHPEWWDGDVPWIGIVDARAHHGRTIFDTIQHTNNAGLENSAARLLPPGTVCISRTASVGYVLVTGRAMATSQDFVNWIPTAAVLSDWLRVIFSADREALRRFGKGSVHKTIYFPEWLSVHVALPPLAEQARIAGEVDSLISVTNALEMAVALQLRRCNRMHQSIFKWAFEGKLVGQDPNDESSENLLARIRHERSAATSVKKSGGVRAMRESA